jgi:hypothetical protein
MGYNTILLPQKEPFIIETSRFLYESLTGKLFFFPLGSQYHSRKPIYLSSARGFLLRNKLIRSILATTDEFEMRETDADAILAGFLILPGEKHLKEIFSKVNKPVIISVGIGLSKTSKLPSLAKKFEILGAAGIYTGRMIPNSVLEKICSACTVPVITSTNMNYKEIGRKINAGAFAIKINGKNISKSLIDSLNESYPNIPVIVYGGKSENIMMKSIESGVDAVIYKPFILFDEKRDDF